MKLRAAPLILFIAPTVLFQACSALSAAESFTIRGSANAVQTAVRGGGARRLLTDSTKQAATEAESTVACKTTIKRVCKTVRLKHSKRSKRECHDVKVKTCPKPKAGASGDSDATCVNVLNNVVRIGQEAIDDCQASKQSAIAQQAACQESGCAANPCAHFLQDVLNYEKVFQLEYDVLAMNVDRCPSKYTSYFDKFANELKQADAGCNGLYTSVCG